MLELGKAVSGEVPVLRDGGRVGSLRSTDFWNEGSVAVVGDREWLLGRRPGGVLAGRWAADPEDAARYRAEQVSAWRGTWRVGLDGVTVDVAPASWWQGTYRFTAGERVLAESGTTGGWSPRPTLTGGEDLSLDARVFLLWLVLVLQRRTYGAAVGAVVVGGAAAGSS